jgi:broad specificity phosphatase PhoE
MHLPLTSGRQTTRVVTGLYGEGLHSENEAFHCRGQCSPAVLVARNVSSCTSPTSVPVPQPLPDRKPHRLALSRRPPALQSTPNPDGTGFIEYPVPDAQRIPTSCRSNPAAGRRGHRQSAPRRSQLDTHCVSVGEQWITASRATARFAEHFHPRQESRVCAPFNPGCRESHIAGGRGWGRGPEMSVSELVIIRHGESAGNAAAAEANAAGAEVIVVDRRDADVPLSPVGIEQARALGSVLRPLVTDGRRTRVWSSPYVRAHETAKYALGEEHASGVRLDERIVLDERLRDRELGVLDLLTTRGVQSRFPLEADRRRWLGKFYHRPPGGESWADVVLRLRSFLSDLAADPADRAVIVGHDAVVLLLRYICESLTEQQVLGIQVDSPVRNGSITRLTLRPGQGWALTDYNDVRHLNEQGVEITEHRGEVDDRRR